VISTSTREPGASACSIDAAPATFTSTSRARAPAARARAAAEELPPATPKSGWLT
jgi:hypothetical protein